MQIFVPGGYSLPVANVLVVDDDADSCEIIARYLGRFGHEVRCVPNGQDALAALGTAVPDFIVLDVRMPGMDGIALLRVIRSYLRWSDVPVAIVTAYIEDPRLQGVSTLGVKRIFSKSQFSFDELLDCVNGSTRPPRPPANPPPHTSA